VFSRRPHPIDHDPERQVVSLDVVQFFGPPLHLSDVRLSVRGRPIVERSNGREIGQVEQSKLEHHVMVMSRFPSSVATGDRLNVRAFLDIFT